VIPGTAPAAAAAVLLAVLSAPAPEARDLQFTLGTVQRRSERLDARKRWIPPWTRVSVHFGFEGERPARGRAITVVPVHPAGLPVLNLKFTKVLHGRGGCEADGHPWWTTEVGIDDSAFLTAEPDRDHVPERPFDAIVIYPAVPFARLVPRSSIQSLAYPEGVPRTAVMTGIDLTGDEQPELLVAWYCCGDPQQSLDRCDFACLDYYQKQNGRWILRDRATPC
jgi:hypothetical protein